MERLLTPVRGFLLSSKKKKKSQAQSCVCRAESPLPVTVLMLELFNRRGIGIKLMGSQSGLDPPRRLTVELHYI